MCSRAGRFQATSFNRMISLIETRTATTGFRAEI